MKITIQRKEAFTIAGINEQVNDASLCPGV